MGSKEIVTRAMRTDPFAPDDAELGNASTQKEVPNGKGSFDFHYQTTLSSRGWR